MRDYLRVEHMASFIPDACELVETLRKNSPASRSLNPVYFDEVLQRLRIFERDLARKQLNAKLSSDPSSVWFCGHDVLSRDAVDPSK